MSTSDDLVRYERVKEIVGEALLLDASERDDFARCECGDDTALLAEVEVLLGFDEQASGLLDEAGREREAIVADLRDTMDEDAEVEVPERIGRFRVLRWIATGGMGSVYEARQDQPTRRVALKLLRQDLATPSLLKRFEREAEILGRLQHPGIAQVYEAGTTDLGGGSRPWFSMEFVEGEPLGEYANRRGLETDDKLELVAKICDAVDHAHAQGVVHRDLKPDNVLVTAEGRPKVLDFGVARAVDADLQVMTRVTEVGQIMGTLPYMSPEQASGDPGAIDGRSDVYALGVILFELLANRRPLDLQGRALPAAIRAIGEEEATRLGALDTRFTGDVDVIVGKALEKERGRRYATAGAMAADIRRHLCHEPLVARPASRVYLARKFVRRHRGLVAGLVVAFAALVAGLAVAVEFGLREAESARIAERAEYKARLIAVASQQEIAPRRARALLEEIPEELRHFEWELLRVLSAAGLTSFRAEPSERTVGGSPHVAWAATRPDGSLFGALENGGAIDLVDLESGAVVRTVDEGGRLTRPVLSADGSVLRAVDDGGRVVFWDTVTGERLGAWRHHPAHLKAFALDGTRYVSFDASAGRQAERVLQVVTPREADEITQAAVTRPASTQYWAMALAPDGRTLFSRDELVDVVTGERLSEGRTFAVGGAPTQHAAFSADGRWLATGSSQGVVGVHDLREDAPPLELEGFTVNVVGLAFDPDARCIAAVSAASELVVWELPSGRLRLREVVSHPHGSLALSPGGERIACGTADGLTIFGAVGYRRIAGHDGAVTATAFSPDGSLMATGGGDGHVRLWDPANGEAVASFVVDGAPQALEFTPDGSAVVLDLAGERVVYDAVTLRSRPSRLADIRPLVLERESGRLPARVTAATLSPDERLLAAGTSDGSLHVLDASDGRLLDSADVVDGPVHAVAFHPSGERLAATGRDGVVRIWRTEPLEELWSAQAYDAPVSTLAFSPDGTRLAAGAADGRVSVWSTRPEHEQAERLEREDAWDAVRPMVHARLDAAGGDVEAVVASIRGDDTLSPDVKAAGLWVLRTRGAAEWRDGTR